MAESSEERWTALRAEAIKEAFGLQMAKGLDFESFIAGLHLALTDRQLGEWIAAAFDKDSDSAVRLRHSSEQIAARLREKLEMPPEWRDTEQAGGG